MMASPSVSAENAAGDVDRELGVWADGLGIACPIPRPAGREGFGSLAVRCHPHADADRVMLAGKLVTTMAAIDGYYRCELARGNESARVGARLVLAVSAMERPSMPQHDASLQESGLIGEPWLRALHEVMSGVAEASSAMVVDRLRREIMVALVDLVGSGRRDTHQRTPQPWESSARWPWTAGPPNVAIIDIVNGYELSIAQFSSRPVRRMTTMACNLLAYLADPRSGADPTRTEPRQLAGPAERDGQDDVMDAYIATESEFTAEAEPEIRRYLGDLRHWLRGNIDWRRAG